MHCRLRPIRILLGIALAAAIAFSVPATFRAAQSQESPAGPAASGSKATLDYEFFKTRVEPIFLKKRSPAHARCYVCHQVKRHKSGFHLEELSPGQSFWTDEQSRRNFQTVSKLVVPGKPLAGLFPKHPLSPLAGGDAKLTHNGGRQFESQSDPDFQTIVAWIRGEKAAGSSGQ